ncbi:MAG: hypothetical protein Tsb005_00540 [Gammaproteobacteria bacterium]
MKILVFNAGSSSLKFGVFDMTLRDSRIFKGEFERFQNGKCVLHFRQGGVQSSEQQRVEQLADINAAICRLPDILNAFGYTKFDAMGYRIAHGGEKFHKAMLIDDSVLTHIESCTPLAPLHNPAHIATIRLGRQLWPNIPHVAVFDTAFHHTIPEHAYTYAVPKAWRDHGVRRYGFHGTSHKYVALRAAEALQRPVTELKIISCHLGNGASVCAINRGFSVDTSMGMTPLEGLVMGSRSGDVDPGIFSFLQRELGLDIEAIETALYTQSGMQALAGSRDLRDIEAKAMEGDLDAQLAINIYAYRVRKYIGAYMAVMGGVDALVFTGGIGENSASMRRRICDRLGFIGLHLDDVKNGSVKLQGAEVLQIHAVDSAIQVLVTQTAEQWMIAKEVQQLLVKQTLEKAWHIPVAVSARHAHLSQTHVEILFGKNHRLTKQRDLAQPEGWAAAEMIEIIGPKGSLKNVRVLGPTRDRTQIEVSKTDTFALGLEAPVRPSGKLENTPTVILRGPCGEVKTDGLIIAARHIHMNSADAVRMGLHHNDYVDIRLGDEKRAVVFTNTLIRVKDTFTTEMHIDTDEANAAGIAVRTQGELIVNDQTHHASILDRLNLHLSDE